MSILATSGYSEDNLDFIGRIVEDMAYQSSFIVRPAFYDVLLEGQIVRDEESAEMLDYIFNNIKIDFAMVLRYVDMTLIDDLRVLLQTPGTSVSSALKRKINGYKVVVDKAITTALKEA